MRSLSLATKLLLSGALLASVIMVGIADFATGSELAFSVFYFIPIGLAAWFLGREMGTATSVLSAVSWYLADSLARSQPYSYSLIPVWNGGVRLITFLVLTVLLAGLADVLKRESHTARVDHLTGAANARAFYEFAEAEISLLRRYQRPFTLLYLDIDNLKQLNDARGHSEGDKALQATVVSLKRALRPTDTVARLGGDEFAVLLAEADAHAAEVVSTRIRSALNQGVTVHYPVTFSVGALTCSSPPESVDTLIARADDLMYEVKRIGKDAVKRASFGGAA